MKLYSVRIISLDSCMSAPVQGLDVMYSDFRGSSINQVPILRLFGSIPTGEKICVHIHGVFPYIYIPYDGIQEANSLMYRIAASIDKAVNISLKQASSNAQHVYKITLVKGIPMYGYHLREHQFFKIYLYNPLLVRKVASLLMNESTLGKLYQPHEAHLNFTLQFMIDFNLHGMSSMVVSEIKFRRNPDNPSQNINAEDLLPATVIKNTVCELEGDCLAENIVNREEISSGNIAANPGISSLWADEQQRRRNKGESSQIDHLLELNRTHIEPTKSHSVYKQALRDRLSMLSTERNIVEKINSSVYPAETPENLTIKNASMIESETPSSLELSLNDSSWNDLDETTKPSPDIDVNMTLDQDALNLLELLNELGEDAVEDSILTQVVKEDDEEKDLDLSMPLEAVTTPHKIVSSNNDNFEGSDDDMWNTTLIPQLDGESEEIMKNLTTEEYLSYGKRGFKNNDICSVNIKNSPARKLRKKAVFIKVVTTNKAGRDMPDLDEISEIDNEGTNLKNTSSSKLQAKPKKSVRFKRPLMTVIGESRRTKYKKKKLTRKELKERSVRKTEEEVKRLGNRIKKLSRQDQIIMIMRKLHKKEKRLILDINASGVPKFKVLSKDDVKDITLCRKVTDFKEPIIEPVSIRRSERIRAIQNKNVIFSLDGTVDSCSSDDERTERKRKKSLKGTPSRESRRYKALPISVNKSPKVQINPERSASKCEVSMNTQNFQKDATLLDPKPIHTPVCDINVKRQLFTEDSPLNSTRIEEKLVCRHVSVAKRNCITQKIPDEGESEKSSSSIFSSDDDCNEMSFFNPLDIQENQTYTTPAEKYDKENNYVAKEGSSKMFTPLQSQTDPPDIHISSGSSGSVLITPGQRFVSDDEDLTKNSTAVIEKHFQINYLSSNSVTNSNSSSNISITTNKKGPSKREVVESMEKYGIAHVRQQVPFYSNVEDVAGSIEVGFNILKISSLTTAHLPEFESQTDSLNIFRKNKLDILSSTLQWSSSSIKTMILSFCKDRECIITPVKRTPTTKEVLNWLKEKAVNDVIKEKNIEKRTKIHLPLSPRNEGKDEEYDLDMSLTLTPCTPSNSQDSSKAAERSADSASPVFGKECKARKKEIFNKTLRTPLFPSQESSINHSCQITGLMVNHSFEKSARNLQDARAVLEHQNITVLVMELHIRTRGDFKPDPNHDSIRAIFYTIHHDVPEPSNKAKTCKGVIAINDLPLSSGVSNTPILNGIGLDCNIAYVDSEENLFDEFLKVIAYWDPDICAGYEIELLSWGYLMDRASHMGKNIKNLLGRTQINNLKWKDEEAPNELKITGRIVLDVWRLMRHEISLQSYTFESIMFHILHKREPYYSFRDLSFWWDHRSNLYRYRTVKYYITRVTAIIDLFDKLDFIGRTSELARLFGIQFFEVLSRGSQFRVESMMLRLAKPLNFIPVSPNVQQRAQMKAPEFISLVLEPESKLYNDPVIVLDFQSLYPSIIIAYNYCFTTCIGRVQSLGKNGPFEFGATQLKISRKLLRKLLEKDSLNFSPCGVGFVKKKVRDGIMPRMLREILDTRLMVKNSMKENKEDKILQKVLHSRQLGLKLIANVTYGYTAANFSGRMPSVEVGDSVVSKGRETLQRAIEMVDSTPEWGAKVVYGDTDSLFVLVPGQSRARAFEVGKQIADAVTKANPDPMKLKLEKVYQPCILQTKKRYVGYMFESIDQKEPIYEAKGIETVRRDGCPAVSKMLEKCLRLLFETKDVSLVKKYVLKQFNKIFSGRASIQDLTFAKEYRGAAGYRPGACVPALELTRKWTAVDKRNEPRSGERVPYVIINGPPGLPLIRLVRSPRDLLNDSSLRPNALYYITRVIIPPINRCFNLIGADLHTWFNQMPRKVTQYLSSSVSPKKKSTISQYFSTYTCACCGEQTQMGICQNCCCNPQKTVITLMEKMRLWENNFVNMNLVCHSCTSGSTEIKCVSLDCPVLYRRIQTARDVQQVDYVRRLLTTSDW
ncbi:DNA polymerase zeta catalytic subunit isoform X2 [Leptinotarsa decemlineata]|uniref:DNA polymerase zeta catalytic subunit isoform X2 n=1 Tax=Leptinotarsa decemlineata TaxID=7539 RepID=UPI003D30C969